MATKRYTPLPRETVPVILASTLARAGDVNSLQLEVDHLERQLAVSQDELTRMEQARLGGERTILEHMRAVGLVVLHHGDTVFIDPAGRDQRFRELVVIPRVAANEVQVEGGAR